MRSSRPGSASTSPNIAYDRDRSPEASTPLAWTGVAHLRQQERDDRHAVEGPEGTDGSTGFGSPAWTRAALLALVVLLPLVLALDQGTVVRRSFNAGVANARRALRNRRPDVAWQAADPEHEGLNGAVLDSLRLSLAEGTESFLVVRGNHVVYEWYATGSGPNLRRGTAAMAKAITGTLVALTAATDRRIGLDDPAWKYIPRWHADSIRSKIRIGDLASHHSGMDNVDFGAGRDGKLEGWKKRYYEHRGERFELALDTAPILFPPGTRSSYSGVGYYALAYALAASLKGAPQQDVRTLLRERIMGPLGIPDQDWQLRLRGVVPGRRDDALRHRERRFVHHSCSGPGRRAVPRSGPLGRPLAARLRLGFPRAGSCCRAGCVRLGTLPGRPRGVRRWMGTRTFTAAGPRFLETPSPEWVMDSRPSWWCRASIS